MMNALTIKTRSTIAHPHIFNKVSGETTLEEGLQSIRTSLRLLLSTAKGELLGDPNYGTDLRTLLYQYKSVGLEDEVRREVLTAVRLYERRVSLDSSDIDINYVHDVMHVTLNYRLVRTDIMDSIELVLATNDFSSSYFEEVLSNE